MNCPYCKNEMELGKVEMISSPPGYIKQTFKNEYELQKGFLEKVKETVMQIRMGINMNNNNISLKNSEKAYWCECCSVVFAEFDLQ